MSSRELSEKFYMPAQQLKKDQDVKNAKAAAGTPKKGGRPAGKAFIESLPFSMTAAQRRALADVDRDLVANVPMVRLVQGDVRSEQVEVGDRRHLVADLVRDEPCGAGHGVSVREGH